MFNWKSLDWIGFLSCDPLWICEFNIFESKCFMFRFGTIVLLMFRLYFYIYSSGSSFLHYEGKIFSYHFALKVRHTWILILVPSLILRVTDQESFNYSVQFLLWIKDIWMSTRILPNWRAYGMSSWISNPSQSTNVILLAAVVLSKH